MPNSNAAPEQLTPLLRPHLGQVAALEASCFSAPWSISALEETLDAGGQGLVMIVKDALVGYLLTRFVPDGVEILKIAVQPDLRRTGIAGRLLQAGLQSWRGSRSCAVWLEVRESNLAARRLYRAHSFQEAGRRPRYYRDPEEDALMLRRDFTIEEPIR
jgi:ribosomal-protein-alanine N-acetyltransferase